MQVVFSIEENFPSLSGLTLPLSCSHPILAYNEMEQLTNMHLHNVLCIKIYDPVKISKPARNSEEMLMLLLCLFDCHHCLTSQKTFIVLWSHNCCIQLFCIMSKGK